MENIPAAAGILIAVCIAGALTLEGEKLSKERPGLIVIAIFALWSLASIFVQDILQEFVSNLAAQRITTGLGGAILLLVAWVRIHSINEWRFNVIFWPTAVLAAAVGLGVVIISMGGQWPHITQKVGAYTLIIVCCIQAFVLVRRATEETSAS